ncbi:Recombination protein MgsA [Rubrimonas cliftonensis]|uniref:Recombination protein MgsA n=1 Tax=Rubrimonas cliftonensis TaxID=89524 RepID=A0A1H4A527_9RHOB|nr:Recombination protein MgsA [Rubrimonas cliftonensis]
MGKTTIARLLARESGLRFEQISAIFSGVAELRKVFDAAAALWRTGRATLLFVDEIHRFNRAQQDGFLPHMETGAVILVGATTENPSFALNAALLSRAQVLRLAPLDEAAIHALLQRAEADAGRALPVDAAGRAALAGMADGDGRAALNLAEAALALEGGPHGPAELSARLARRAALYDRTGDQHFGLISALHKAVRGSDPDAALYWLARMLQGGEDPRYLARRLIRMAAEDVGLADPQALGLAVAARDTYETLGSPEGDLALAEAAAYLALAPKSNALYAAFKAAQADARETAGLPPPAHILNAPTRLMKEQGFGAGYAYDHDAPDAFSGQDYFPERLGRRRYYAPTDRGFEQEMGARMARLSRLRAARGGDDADGAGEK